MINVFFDKKVVILFLFIILLGFGLRAYRLNSLPVFVDEAIYIRWSQVMRADETLRFLPLSDGKQPLFMWLTIPFLKIIKDPLLAGRAVSVLSGLGTITLSFLISLSLFRSKKVALLAALLVSLSPFMVFFDRLALVDSFLTFWAMLTLFLGILLVKSPRLDLGILTGVALGGAWLTKSPGQLFFVLLPTCVLLVKQSTLGKMSFLTKLIALTIVAWVVGFGLYNILRLGPNFHLIGTRNSDYLYTFSELFQHPDSPLISNLKSVANWFVLLLPLPFILAALIGLFLGVLTSAASTVLLVVWSFLPIVLSASVGKVFTARYILYTIPPILILVALGVRKLASVSRVAKVILLALIFIPAIWQDLLFSSDPAKAWIPPNERHGYLEEWTSGPGLPEIASYLINKPSTTPILVGTEGFFGTTPDGLEIYLEGRKNIRVVGLAYPIKDVPDALKNSVKDNEVYLVVNKSRLLLDNPTEKGLILISEFNRPNRPDGTSDTLMFFRYLGP